jgi:FtsP/CotA-like multicopper oxidase with cupredoxin domain
MSKDINKVANGLYVSRRRFVRATISSGIAASLASHYPVLAFGTTPLSLELKATPGRVRIVPEPYNKTDAWCYNNSVPGPEIRVTQGDRLKVEFDNGLDEETTVHWHGIRLPNAMDGVPHLTQKPIFPEEKFTYEFDAVDAGTFWYHPHQRGSEQVGRGLHGALIVEEKDPLQVDRDVVWVLDDWRLKRSAEISGDFENPHDMSHNGRIGNTVSINGKIPDVFEVRTNERIRLRLINSANARIFGLDFGSLSPVIIALDGQPVTPHTPDDNLVILGPGMRADLILDMTDRPDSQNTINDVFYQGREYALIDIKYGSFRIRKDVPDWSVELPPNPLAEPDFVNAEHHEILFTGGMMGQMVEQKMGVKSKSDNNSGNNIGSMMGMMHEKNMWFINGMAADGHITNPLLVLKKDRSYVFKMINATAWHHPIHLHGHSFRVISRDGVPTPYREWQDTVLMNPQERVEIAFVADNPGDWMFHCHILEHMAAGMMGVMRVV